jgi:hypothetical protein
MVISIGLFLEFIAGIVKPNPGQILKDPVLRSIFLVRGV